jgi:hypothetical protein
MAARIKKVRHDENTRSRIQGTQLVKRLQDYAFGLIQLDATQVRAIEVLLRKCMPDLSSQQLTGDKDNPVHQVSRIERDIVDPMPVPSQTEVARVH